MTIYADLLDRRVGGGASFLSTYVQDDFPAAFPYNRWVSQSQKYMEYWQWFTGEIWEETIPNAKDKNGNKVFKFPLKLNLIKTAAMKQNYVLFGEVADGPEPMVPCRVKAKQKADGTIVDQGARTRAKELEMLINDVWMDNNGRAMQLEGGLVQGGLGGIAYIIRYDPMNTELEFGIKIEMVLPDFFLPVWDSSNPDNLLEAFIVWRVPAREAMLKYGYEHIGETTPPEFLLYVEHWTRETVSITLGGKPITYDITEVDEENGTVEEVSITYENTPNVFGFIPIVYIPRERIGEYYGIPIGSDLFGLAREINARMADMGDVIAESSHRDIFVKNIPGQIKTRNLGDKRMAIDLGSRPSPTLGDPEVTTVDPPIIPESLVGFGEILRKQFLRDAFMSAVAEGEDEGSQRSALTLAFRMWPLTSKARAIRTYWTNGLIRMNKMIAKIAIMHGIGGITQEHVKDVRIFCEWSPMIPRDREQMVNEVTLLMQSDAISPETALTVFGYAQDEVEEMAKVRAWLEYKASLQMQIDSAKKVATAVQGPVASSGFDSR